MRLTIGSLSLISFTLFCQNLVPNSGFEDHNRCPNGFNVYGQAINIPNWFSPNTGTPDYFNECGSQSAKARMNWAGRCEDFSGKGYAGIITFMDKRTYREYLSVALSSQLDSGVTYSLQFSFRLSSYSKVSTGNIGLAFSPERLEVKHDKVILLKPALVAMPDSAIVKETGNWQIASADYVASGKERFLTIGNFNEKNSVYKIKFGGIHEPMLQHASFYYIDDVVVQPQVEFIPALPIAGGDNPFEEDSVMILKNVQFAYNSSALNKNGESELNRLYDYLNTSMETKIEISGHTDDQGSDGYNQQLSLRRAKAVADFLIEKGIRSTRLKYIGYGKTRPLINSTDEMARIINRRVEVKLAE